MRAPATGRLASKVASTVAVGALVVLVGAATIAVAATDVKTNQNVGIDLQNEVNLAVNPSNPNNIVVVHHTDPDLSLGFDTGPGLGVDWTTNGGVSWNSTDTPTVWGHDFDPTVAIDTSGRIFAGSISSTSAYAYPMADTGVFVSRSTDGGQTWSQPTTVEAFMGGGVSTVPFDDKCMMTCDNSPVSPLAGRLHITWQRDETDWTHSSIYAACSTDQANSFSAPVKVSDPPTSTDEANAPVPDVAVDGTLCVAWIHTQQPNPAVVPGWIMFDKSTDGGATWGTDVTAAVMSKVAKYPNLPPYATWRANSFPAVAVDPLDSRYVYIAYTGDPDGPDPPGLDVGDIYLVRSSNGGASWGAPQRVNDDSTFHGQFSPWIDVNGSGHVYVAWYDRRTDPADIHPNVFYAVSTDRGATFSTNQQVNDVPMLLIPDGAAGTGSECWFGEYLGLAVGQGRAHIAWTEPRFGERDIFWDWVPDPSGVVTGTVTDGSTPLASIQVDAFRQVASTWVWGGCTTTKGDGTYTLGLPANTYRLRYTDKLGRYLREWYANAGDISVANDVPVAGGTLVSGLDATMAGVGAVEGTIVNDSGVGLPGIKVDAWRWTGAIWSWERVATTKADGTYRVGYLPSGGYRVRYTDPGNTYRAEYYDDALVASGATTQTVGAGTTLTGRNATLTGVGKISGTVRDGGASPIANILVDAWRWTGSSWVWERCTATKGDGTYTLGYLPAGTYRTRFADPTYTYRAEYYNDKTTLATADDIAVTAGATVSGTDAVLGPGP